MTVRREVLKTSDLSSTILFPEYIATVKSPSRIPFGATRQVTASTYHRPRARESPCTAPTDSRVVPVRTVMGATNPDGVNACPRTTRGTSTGFEEVAVEVALTVGVTGFAVVLVAMDGLDGTIGRVIVGFSGVAGVAGRGVGFATDGQAANSQVGGVRPTYDPSGHCFASIVQAISIVDVDISTRSRLNNPHENGFHHAAIADDGNARDRTNTTHTAIIYFFI